MRSDLFTPSKPLSRLLLGAAQLGMPYGIANQTGLPDEPTVNAIFDEAFVAGIRIIDTAQHYGESERRIGKYLSENPDKSFSVISKLDPKLNALDKNMIIESVQKSHEMIGASLNAMMIHNMKWISSGIEKVKDALHYCINNEYVQAFGISVYSVGEFQYALNIEGLKLIQIPFNIFDRRFLASDLLNVAFNKGISVFIRSVFLQGLLIMPEQEAKTKVPGSSVALTKWHNLCRSMNYNPLDVALSYVLQCLPHAFVVVGCELPQQVIENRIRESFQLPRSIIEEINSWQIPTENIINPMHWR